jgi:hypothetical protein
VFVILPYLPEGSIVSADRGCTEYTKEDLLEQAQSVQLSAMRKKNSRRAMLRWTKYLQFHGRKMIETTGSLISQLLLQGIQAITPAAFEPKAFLFALAYSIHRAL